MRFRADLPVWMGVAVLALVAFGWRTLASQHVQAAGLWYVAPGGNNGNDCASPATPCATINGALGKAASGDTIYVAEGTYTGSGSEVVLIDKNIPLSGGWDESFTARNGTSVIIGGTLRTGIVVTSGITTTIDFFTIQGSKIGIFNHGTLTLNDSTISDNSDSGIYNDGTLNVANSTISNNSLSGITNYKGSLTMNMVIVSNNKGPGVSGSEEADMLINNSTINDNVSGVSIFGRYVATINNSFIHHNNPEGGLYADFDSLLVLNSTTVSKNTGLGISIQGDGILNNSTVSMNTGGGISVGGNLTLNNSTVSGNESPGFNAIGGVSVGYSGFVTLKNSILAGNLAESGPDCGGVGIFSSSGYNIIGDTTGCTFNDGTGDLLDINPLIFPILMGSPGYHPLIPGSPAIDAGHPAGCTDHLGNPLETDQRGVARVGRCDIGAYEYDRNNDPLSYVYLSRITQNYYYCPDFFDDFSDPSSGWPVGEDGFHRFEYLDGEYRILTKQPGFFYLFTAPTCSRENYVVEVDARWPGTPGASYGLIFGAQADFSHYYLFDVNTDFRDFRLLRRGPDGFSTIVPITPAAAVNGGTITNHLKVTRFGDQIILEINGTILGAWKDGNITGPTLVGIVSSPYYDEPVSDARFDNFSVQTLPSNSKSVQSGYGSSQAASGARGSIQRHIVVPIEEFNWLPGWDD